MLVLPGSRKGVDALLFAQLGASEGRLESRVDLAEARVLAGLPPLADDESRRNNHAGQSAHGHK